MVPCWGFVSFATSKGGSSATSLPPVVNHFQSGASLPPPSVFFLLFGPVFVMRLLWQLPVSSCAGAAEGSWAAMPWQHGGMLGGDPGSVNPWEQGCSAGAGCGLGKLGRSRFLGGGRLYGLWGLVSLLPYPFNI